MREYKLPTRQECYALLKEFEVPEHIIKHSELVNKIAMFLAKRLKKAGVDIDVELVDRASLLHDLDKMQTWGKPNHGEVTEEILIRKGYPKVGEIAKYHAFHFVRNKNLSWEAKVMNYSDKRVMHESIGTLKHRFNESWERYKHVYKNRDKEMEKLSEKLEKEIFSKIKLKPEDLKKYIK